MKKKLTAVVALILTATLFFGIGVYASDYIKFTGDSQIAESNEHVTEIMQILRDVKLDKDDAESRLDEALERLAELEAMNPSGLAKENKRLREEVKRLEDEIRRANNKVTEHHGNTTRAIEEAREIGGDEG